MGSKFGTDGKFLKQYNNYDLSGEYGIGYLFNGEEFYFDLEDQEIMIIQTMQKMQEEQQKKSIIKNIVMILVNKFK